MDNNIKISIITVVYNNVQKIENAILSVLKQSYSNIEYIIIDGGSTDGTLDIIKKYDKECKWISEPDNGIYDAMNKGIMMATGDYIQIIGSDDMLFNYNCISDVASILNNNDTIDILSTVVYKVDEKNKMQICANHHKYNFGLLSYPWIQHGGAFVKLSLMKKQLFDTTYKIAADLKFIISCVQNDTVKITYTDIPTVYFALSGVSTENKKQALQENFRIAEELGITYTLEENSYFFNIKEVIKKILGTNIRRKISRKWTKHACNNDYCRWCNK